MKQDSRRPMIDSLPPDWARLMWPWLFWIVLGLFVAAAASGGWYWFR